MELTKQNMVQVTLSQGILAQNFHKIQCEFRKLTCQIAKLTKQSNLIVDKVNEIDPFDQIQNNLLSDQPDETNAKDTSFNQKEINASVSEIQHDLNIESTSKTDIDVKLELDKMKTVGFAKKSRDSFKGSNSRVTKNNSSPSHEAKSFKTMHESLMRDLDQRITQLEQQKQVNEDKIECLEKENDKIKSCLGFKKKQKPNKAAGHKKAKASGSIKNIEENNGPEQSGKNSVNNSSNELDSNLGESLSFLQEFHKEFQALKQNCIDKFSYIELVHQKINKDLTEQSEKQEAQRKLIYNKIQEIQDKDKDVSMMIAQRSGKSYHTNPQITRNLKSATDMNETMESYKNYYEDKVIEIFEQMQKIRNEYLSIVDRMNQQGLQNGEDHSKKELERMKNIALRISGKFPAVEEDSKVKKEISSIKREVKKIRDEFEGLIGGINTGVNETRTLIIKPNQTKEDWKSLSQKIFKLKQQMMSYIKQLEAKIFTNKEIISLTHELEVGIGECKILLNKKANIIDFEKSTKRIESRLNNFIKQVYEKQGMTNQQEALLAKQPWFCLSCDSEIKNYSGKLGKTMNNERFLGKKVNPQSHMVRRNESNNRLPTIHS